MLDFEEELKKLDLWLRHAKDENNLADVTDLLDEMLKEIKNRQ